MILLLTRVIGVGIETADMLVHEILSRPLRDRKAVARYAGLTGSPRLAAESGRVVELLGDLLARHPTAFAHTALSADLFARGLVEVVIAGERPDLLGVVRSRWLPGAVVAWGERTDSPLWEDRGVEAAYVCREQVCRLPVTDPQSLEAELAAVSA